jgi:hypothetical protein
MVVIFFFTYSSALWLDMLSYYFLSIDGCMAFRIFHGECIGIHSVL